MVEKRFAKNPLLYIEQPTIGVPKAPMQHDYFTPRVDKVNTKQAEVSKRDTSRRPQKRRYFFEEEQAFREQEEIELEEQMQQDQEKYNTEKKFKDMTLQEKVQYFVEMPDHILMVRCEIVTEDRKYQGVITDFKDDYVYIRIGRRTTSEKIRFSHIKSIRMLGF